jgi:hypothetical protein
MASFVFKKLKLLYKWQLILGLNNIQRKGFKFEFELKPRYIVADTVTLGVSQLDRILLVWLGTVLVKLTHGKSLTRL